MSPEFSRAGPLPGSISNCARTGCLVLAVVLLGASPLPADLPAQRNSGFESRTVAIVKARLVVSPDQELEQGTLVIRDGLIAAVGPDLPAPPDAEIIDGAGLIVYPGFIDA